jgi:hypothetical protein
MYDGVELGPDEERCLDCEGMEPGQNGYPETFHCAWCDGTGRVKKDGSGPGKKKDDDNDLPSLQ